MSGISITYTGPFDAVEIDGVGVVRQGETVNVPADLAGHAPRGKPVNKDGSESKSYSPGEGLLAQVDAWTSATKSESDHSDEEGTT